MIYKILSELPMKDLRQLTKEFNRGSSKNSTKNQLIASLMAPNQTGGSKFSELPAQVILDEFINKLGLDDLSNLVQSDPDLWRIIQNVPMLKSAYDEKMLLGRLHRLRSWLSSLGQNSSIESLKRLNLSNRGLRSIPPEIDNLQQLQYLDLSRNMLTKIPPEIGNLPQLQYLHLNENSLTQIPPEIGNLQSLRELWMYENQLTQIPPEIGNLKRLEELLLGGNRLREIPPEIGNLQSLEALGLTSNQLTEIPPEIGKLRPSTSETKNAGNLHDLDLRNNELSAAVKDKIRALLPDTNIIYSNPRRI